MRILFQGDSITDCNRNRNDFYDIGNGYPKYVAQFLRAYHPEMEFEFINRGCSGNKTFELGDRWNEDCIDLKPDVVSILIGINDTWHLTESRNYFSHEKFENDYRFLLEEIKTKTSAKIIMMEQFLVYTPEKAFFREDVDPKIQVTRKLAREYADAFIPLDGLLASYSIDTPPTKWAADGVHPTEAGSTLIAKFWVEAFEKILHK